MNEQDSHPTGGEVTPTGEFGSRAVRLDEGHVVGDGGIPERFQNPGFEPHTPRGADLDEAAAKRAERIVGGLFIMSILCYYWQRYSSLPLLEFVLGVMAFAYSGLLGVYFTALFTKRGSSAPATRWSHVPPE